MSTPIKDIMTKMPHAISQEATPEMAQIMMKKFSCHHLPVIDSDMLVGIISDTDIRFSDKSDKNLKIEDIMTKDPITVEPNKDVFQVAMLMQEKNIGSVIVSAAPYSPWGIFTATDALAYLGNKSE